VLVAAPSASPSPSLTPMAVALGHLPDVLPPASPPTEEAEGLGWRPVLLALLGLQILGMVGVAWRLMLGRKTAA